MRVNPMFWASAATMLACALCVGWAIACRPTSAVGQTGRVALVVWLSLLTVALLYQSVLILCEHQSEGT